MIDFARAASAARNSAPMTIHSDGFALHVNFPTVSVKEVRTGVLVAYSSMRTDFEASLEEFARDYVPGALRAAEGEDL